MACLRKHRAVAPPWRFVWQCAYGDPFLSVANHMMLIAGRELRVPVRVEGGSGVFARSDGYETFLQGLLVGPIRLSTVEA